MADEDYVTSQLVAVEELQDGDLIDLQGDPYADVGDHADAGTFEYEVAEVVGVEFETSTCVRVDLANLGGFGFPPGHCVLWVGNAVEERS
jgi:hypothetical protein